MSPTYTGKGNRRYRYYICGKAQQHGWSECPSPSVPAGEIEQFVVEQIKGLGRDPAIIAETIRHVRSHTEGDIERLGHERQSLLQQLRGDNARLQAAAAMSDQRQQVSLLADLHDRVRLAERRLTEIDNELILLRGQLINETDIANALADFDKVWETLAPREQARVLELVVKQVEYDGQHGNVKLTFHPTGIQSLRDALANHQEDAA